MTPAARAVEAGARAIHGVEARKAGWSLPWAEETEATRDAYRRGATLAVRAALGALAADTRTAGLRPADLLAEVETDAAGEPSGESAGAA